MLGVVLLYVGIVLINNGICRISNINPKSTAIMNLFVGSLCVVCNVFAIAYGEFIADSEHAALYFYAGASGLLFAFTYLLVAFNCLYNLDVRVLGWYSLFVAINTIPAAYLSFMQGDNVGNCFAIIWLAWGVLWLTGFMECVLKIELKFVPYLAILEGIFTAWIPAWLFLTNIW